MQSRVRTRRYLAFGVVASCFLIPLHLEAKELSSLIVHVDCREVGRLYLFLVDEVTFSVPGKGLKLIERDINTAGIDKPIDIVFTELRPGKYAIRAFVDQNGNKKLDWVLFGPVGPWGFSWKANEKNAIPRFSDAAIQIGSDSVELSMKVSR